MVTAIALSLVLAFTPDASKWEGALTTAADAPKLSLAVPGFKGVDLSQEKAEFFSGHFATQLTKQGLSVSTAQDIQALISMSQQKQMLGCGDSASDKCMTEIANALGTDGIVVGSVANLSGDIAVNLKVIDAVDGRTLALYSADAPSEKAALDMLTQAAKDVADQLKAARARPSASSTESAVHPDGENLPKPEPAQVRYVRQPSSTKKWGVRLMIFSAVTVGVALVSLVAGAAIGGGFGGFLILCAIAEFVLAPVLLVSGFVMWAAGTDEMVPVRAELTPPEKPRLIPTPMVVALRF